MRFFKERKRLAVLLIIALFLGLQLSSIGLAMAEGTTTETPVVSGESVPEVDGAAETYGLAISSVSPNQAAQNSLIGIVVTGSGFLEGSYTYVVNLVKDSEVIYCLPTIPTSSTQITCLAYIYGELGVYDVVVSGAGQQARLSKAFTVTEPTCGVGSGASLLMLGMTLGLLSLAGSGGILARRRRRKNS